MGPGLYVYVLILAEAYVMSYEILVPSLHIRSAALTFIYCLND